MNVLIGFDTGESALGHVTIRVQDPPVVPPPPPHVTAQDVSVPEGQGGQVHFTVTNDNGPAGNLSFALTRTFVTGDPTDDIRLMGSMGSCLAATIGANASCDLFTSFSTPRTTGEPENLDSGFTRLDLTVTITDPANPNIIATGTGTAIVEVLDVPVPEPSTYLLFGNGLLVLFLLQLTREKMTAGTPNHCTSVDDGGAEV